MEEEFTQRFPQETVLMEWSYPEYEEHHRSHSWYFWYGIIATFLVGFAIYTDNFLFAVIIILSSLILFLQNWEKPRDQIVQLRKDGLYYSNKLYSYRDITEFWLAYNPPYVEKIYLNFSSTFIPTQGIPLMGNNPLQVREILLEYVPENLDNEEEPTVEALARLLKF